MIVVRARKDHVCCVALPLRTNMPSLWASQASPGSRALGRDATPDEGSTQKVPTEDSRVAGLKLQLLQDELSE